MAGGGGGEKRGGVVKKSTVFTNCYGKKMADPALKKKKFFHTFHNSLELIHLVFPALLNLCPVYGFWIKLSDNFE